MNWLDYRRNVYSQNGEDGVIEAMMSRFGIVHGQFCEFGAWDGKHLSNTFNLLENHGWSGVLIESDEQRCDDLKLLENEYDVETIQSLVSHEGDNRLDALLANTKLKKDFDLLSVDVDGMDYHIWKAFVDYRPKFVIIEVNSSYGNERVEIASEVPELAFNKGSSFMAMCELGKSKGYAPLAWLGNVFFGEMNFLSEKGYNVQWLKE